MIIYHSLLTILWGYISHFTYAKTRLLGNGWSQIAAYTIGSMAVLPSLVIAYLIMRERRHGQEHPMIALFLAWLVSYGSFGLGTVLGWIVNPYEGPMMDEGD